MVDVSGATPIDTTAATRIAATTPVAAPAPATSVGTPTNDSDLAQTSGLARAMAASAPIDTDRVATIKKAIAEGRFPIVPAKIADRLIALKLQWHPDDGEHDGPAPDQA